MHRVLDLTSNRYAARQLLVSVTAFRVLGSECRARDLVAMLIVVRACAEEAVQIHPCSVNFALPRFESRALVYHEKVQTSQIWLRDCTAVGALPLLLFGGEVARQPTAGTVTIDGWLKLDCAPKVAVLLAELRARLDCLLQVTALASNP